MNSNKTFSSGLPWVRDSELDVVDTVWAQQSREALVDFDFEGLEWIPFTINGQHTVRGMGFDPIGYRLEVVLLIDAQPNVKLHWIKTGTHRVHPVSFANLRAVHSLQHFFTSDLCPCKKKRLFPD